MSAVEWYGASSAGGADKTLNEVASSPVASKSKKSKLTKEQEAAAAEFNENHAQHYDEVLKVQVSIEYGVEEGDMGIKQITSQVPKGFGLTDNGLYIEPKGQVDNGITFGVHKSDGKEWSEIHISPGIIDGNSIAFKATVGHELIHAYHFNIFGYFYYKANLKQSEAVGYEYSARVFKTAGMMDPYENTINTTRRLGYYSGNGFSYPDNFKIPLPVSFYTR